MNPRHWVLACWLIALAGCFTQPITRFQTGEENDREKDLAVPTIGDVTEVANVMAQRVYGVGLVTGLEGTGDCPKGDYRKMLEQDLRKHKVEKVKNLLDDPSNCLVIVTGIIPPGSRKGELIDITVTLPPGSQATSLRGGYLQDCTLRNYENAQNLSSSFEGNRWLQGHVLARARGPLIVGLGNPDDPAEIKRAQIWEGGVSLIDRPYYYVLKNDEKSVRIANSIAERINHQFRDDPKRQQIILENQRYLLLNSVTEELNGKLDPNVFQRGDMAKAMNKEMISVRLPFAYRFNAERFWRVSRLIPLRENPEDMTRYRQRLQKMLLDPADTLRAAHRLEALGKESVPLLKKGLQSESPLVRFAAAEALCYLGETAGAVELGKLADKHSQLRFYCLMALANLDESVCRSKLGEMLAAEDVELRCGAFYALRLMDERDRRLGGEKVKDTFWLHRVASSSKPLVNFQMGKRAEVVIFGDVRLQPPVKLYAAPEFTVTAVEEDEFCFVSRIQKGSSPDRRPSGLKLDEVLKTMAELGAVYADIVEFLRKAEELGCLNAPVRINLMPPEISLDTLVEAGRDPEFLRED